MTEKVIDLNTYRIERSLKMNGFIVKKDKGKNIKLLIKIIENDEIT